MKKALIKLAIGLALIGLLVYLGRRHLGRLELILTVTPAMLAALVGLFLAGRVVHGEVYRAALETLGVRISYWEAFMLSMRINLANLLFPQGGAGATAVYLKVRHALSYADFASLFLALNVLQFACFAVVGLACNTWLWAFDGVAWSWLVAGALVAVGAGSVGALVLPVRVAPRWRGRLGNFLQRFLKSLALLRRDRRMLLRVVVLEAGTLVTLSLRLWACFYALGHAVPAHAAVLITVLGHVGMRVAPTPGGLGFREAAIAVVSSLLEADASVAVAAAVLDRAVATACGLLIGQVGLWQFLRPQGAGSADTPSEERVQGGDHLLVPLGQGPRREGGGLTASARACGPGPTDRGGET